MRHLVGSIVVGIALVASGCGGADGGAPDRPAPSGPLLSKAAFLHRADAICRRADERGRAAVDRYGVNSKGGIRGLGAAMQDAYDQLAALHGPDAQQRAVQTYLDRKDDAEDVVRQIFAASRDDDDAEVDRLQGVLDDRNAVAARAAHAAGLDACVPG